MTHRDGLPRFSARSVRPRSALCDAAASGAVRDAVRKPWQAAVPVAPATRRRASEGLDDVLTSPAACLLPDGPHGRSLWVIITAPWY